MQRNKSTKRVWDEVYTKIEYDKIPWYGLPFIQRIKPLLNDCKKSQLILIPGCGTGDSVEQLVNRGFRNVQGTDISSVAIHISKERFPKCKYHCIATEDICKYSEFKDAFVIDWLNLHQISPENLNKYISSLDKISSNLVLAYFYDPMRPYSQKSMVTKKCIYNHDPKLIKGVCRNLKVIKESSFYTSINKRYSTKSTVWRTVLQQYSK